MRLELRTETTVFVAIQLLDLATTALGVLSGRAVEFNPLAGIGWGWMIAAKLAAVLFVGWTLEHKRPNRLDFVIPLAAGVIVPWNLLNILLV